MTGLGGVDAAMHRAWREQQRAEAERKAERQRARHFDALVERAYTAIRSVTRHDPTPEQVVLVRDLCGWAAEEPLVDIQFTFENSLVRRVMTSRGRAFAAQRTIVIPPITDMPAYATAGHELAHVRAGLRGRVLERELAAWELAIRRLRCWSAEAHKRMRDSLMSYIESDKTDRADTLTVIRAEALMSEATRRANNRPVSMAVEADALKRFRELHGRRKCAGRYCTTAPREACVMVAAVTPLCRRCYEQHQADMSLAQLRRERKAGR